MGGHAGTGDPNSSHLYLHSGRWGVADLPLQTDWNAVGPSRGRC